MKSNAIKQFEKLDYQVRVNRFNITCSKKTNYENGCHYNYKTFVFDFLKKEIQMPMDKITFEELQAINKQVEELGWNNGNK